MNIKKSKIHFEKFFNLNIAFLYFYAIVFLNILHRIEYFKINKYEIIGSCIELVGPLVIYISYLILNKCKYDENKKAAIFVYINIFSLFSLPFLAKYIMERQKMPSIEMVLISLVMDVFVAIIFYISIFGLVRRIVEKSKENS
ncbi:hypothetical protein SAMN02745883_00862 [Caminicella sporogenes DSM 14501]|uniref:Uncharacterized protein n=1 Tax=Caminicella sporogenes DSM 14501 TaxID=1121266 RepID=A0A1M6NFP5_9FIRM|nr:hypothetical protein [Caminicella sporogenes]RKD22219.1 hypothetical protein BET04_06285 [Caminicella sporogenes]SHJ94454.1 hypothetical protein SAMN02745883_00862 [Caminicella sporogenes DSM 14501]